MNHSYSTTIAHSVLEFTLRSGVLSQIDIKKLLPTTTKTKTKTNYPFLLVHQAFNQPLIMKNTAKNNFKN